VTKENMESVWPMSYSTRASDATAAYVIVNARKWISMFVSTHARGTRRRSKLNKDTGQPSELPRPIAESFVHEKIQETYQSNIIGLAKHSPVPRILGVISLPSHKSAIRGEL